MCRCGEVKLEGDCFVPVWGGKAAAGEISKDGAGLSAEERQWMETHCVGDDTGDNISAQNRHYCEASVLYWMWKNYDKLGNPDFIGYLQYRRHWILKEEYAKEHPADFYNMVWNECFSEDYQYKIGLSEEAIKAQLTDCDGIFCANDTKRTIEDYKEHHHSQDIKYWHKALEIIQKDWPQYAQAAEEYNHGTWHAWSNCFIMRREDFLEYCPFLFDVLAKIDAFAEPEYDQMTVEQLRVPAYVSETMLGIWWTYKKTQGRHFKSLPLMYIKKPFDSLCVQPRHISPLHKDAIPVVFISDGGYLKYTSVAVASICHNAAVDKQYDIIILEDGKIPPEMKERLCHMGTENVSVRFFNASYYMQHYGFSSFFHRRLNVMPYLKLFIHEILRDYDKAVFLDGDLIVLQDIVELYRQPLDGKLVAACQDTIAANTKSDYWNFRRNYIKENNKMSDVNNFFNTGVLLLDLAAMRKQPELTNLFINEARYQHKDRFYHDQDVLNFVLEGKIKFLPQKYNLNYFLYFPQHLNKVPVRVREEFLTDLQKNDVCVLHYNGNPKPWQPDRSKDWLSDLWWKYARMSPFYEEFIHQTSPRWNGLLLRDALHINRVRCQYWKYRIFMNVVWGNMRQRYKRKKYEYRRRIEAVNFFLGGR